MTENRCSSDILLRLATMPRRRRKLAMIGKATVIKTGRSDQTGSRKEEAEYGSLMRSLEGG